MRDLTPRQETVLFEHFEKPDGVAIQIETPRAEVVFRLIRAGLLRGNGGRRPKRTYMTAKGLEEARRLLKRDGDKLVQFPDRPAPGNAVCPPEKLAASRR